MFFLQFTGDGFCLWADAAPGTAKAKHRASTNVASRHVLLIPFGSN